MTTGCTGWTTVGVVVLTAGVGVGMRCGGCCCCLCLGFILYGLTVTVPVVYCTAPGWTVRVGRLPEVSRSIEQCTFWKDMGEGSSLQAIMRRDGVFKASSGE